ncbi:hypothetical protein HMI55_004200, partial [Coelomomyces lativittatus]
MFQSLVIKNDFIKSYFRNDGEEFINQLVQTYRRYQWKPLKMDLKFGLIIAESKLNQENTCEHIYKGMPERIST